MVQAVVDAVVSLINAKAFEELDNHAFGDRVDSTSEEHDSGAADDTTQQAFDFVTRFLGEGRATAQPQARFTEADSCFSDVLLTVPRGLHLL